MMLSLILALQIAATPPSGPAADAAYTVVRVIDGDTLVVRKGTAGEDAAVPEETPVRLLGIDAPEMAGRRGRAQCHALRAAGFLAKLTEGKQVTLELDHSPGADVQDRFGRTLAYIYLPDGRLVNGELVRLGYARAYLRFPFRYREQFLQFERAAKARKSGLFGSCSAN